jgi:hypothetical protein
LPERGSLSYFLLKSSSLACKKNGREFPSQKFALLGSTPWIVIGRKITGVEIKKQLRAIQSGHAHPTLIVFLFIKLKFLSSIDITSEYYVKKEIL